MVREPCARPGRTQECQAGQDISLERSELRRRGEEDEDQYEELREQNCSGRGSTSAKIVLSRRNTQTAEKDCDQVALQLTVRLPAFCGLWAAIKE